MGSAVSSWHVLSAALSSLHSSPAPLWHPSHGRQPSTNVSSVGPSHWLQFFVNCSSMGYLPRGAVLQEQPTSAQSSHGVTVSFGLPSAPARGPPRAASGYLLHCGPLWAAGGKPASPWSSPWAAGEPLLWSLEHLLPLLCHWPWCLQSCFFYIFSLLSPLAVLFPILKYVITEVLPPLLMGLALASSRSILELAGTGFIGHRASF